MLRILLLSVSFVFLVSCSVKPPDGPICRELKVIIEKKDVPNIGPIVWERPNPLCMEKISESTCGYCVWTVSNKVQFVGDKPETYLYKKSWSQIKTEAVVVPSEFYADVKGAFINMCKKYKECSDEIARWRIKLDSIDSVKDALGNGIQVQ